MADIAAVLLLEFIVSVLTASALAERVLVGFLGLLAWETYNYFEVGYWTWRSGSDVLNLLNAGEVPATGWDGVDRLVEAVLAWPILLTTTVPGPGAGLPAFCKCSASGLRPSFAGHTRRRADMGKAQSSERLAFVQPFYANASRCGWV